MLRYIYLLAISFSLQINSDIFVSSPKIKLNTDQQRLIELKIENTKISDSDVTLFKYKTNELIDKNDINFIHKIHTFIFENNLSMVELACKFIMSKNWINAITIGVTSKEELNSIIFALNAKKTLNFDRVNNYCQKLSQKIKDPRRW